MATNRAAASVAVTGALGAVSLRAYNVAGAAAGVTDTDLTRLIPKILAVQAGLEPELVINGDGSAVRDFVHVVDMAEAFALALDVYVAGQWRAYNVSSGTPTRILDVLQVAQQVTGRPVPVPVRHRASAHDPAVLLADNTRIRHDLGWTPHNSTLTTILTDGWTSLTRKYSL